MTGVVGLTHRNGIWWHEAPLPWRWHRCQVWTSGMTTLGDGWVAMIERCACGAMRLGGDSLWINRNERRKK